MSLHVFQVATPFSTGTGVLLGDRGLLVTNEHVVRDNAHVVIGSDTEAEQLAEVVYLDPYYDLAFLRPTTPIEVGDLVLAAKLPQVGDAVTAVGQHFGNPLRVSEGKVLSTAHEHHGIPFILHDAWQESAHSGGPLFNASGELIGINMYDLHEGKGRSLSLPADRLAECLARYAEGNGRPATRCFNCQKVTFEVVLNPKGFCPNCGSELTLPNMVEDYQPRGVSATVEDIITAAGYDPRLTRRGPNLWSIYRGSAVIQLAYHEDSGLVTGDAYLCSLPEVADARLFAFLLRENCELQQLTFSTFGRDIVLSLLIYDRYLSVDSALPRFQHLFAMADHYDNILVDEYGAAWLTSRPG